MFKYVPTSRNTCLSLVESTLRWRHMAPTAPDTLWCHPYFAVDPFLMHETPNFYIVGGQKRFGTRLVVGEDGEERCRIVLVPEFSETGVMVLVNMQTLAVKTIKFGLYGN
jgi:DNA polymerase delta subunit 2